MQRTISHARTPLSRVAARPRRLSERTRTAVVFIPTLLLLGSNLSVSLAITCATRADYSRRSACTCPSRSPTWSARLPQPPHFAHGAARRRVHPPLQLRIWLSFTRRSARTLFGLHQADHHFVIHISKVLLCDVFSIFFSYRSKRSVSDGRFRREIRLVRSRTISTFDRDLCNGRLHVSYRAMGAEHNVAIYTWPFAPFRRACAATI